MIVIQYVEQISPLQKYPITVDQGCSSVMINIKYISA